jgi:hypothetical protein
MPKKTTEKRRLIKFSNYSMCVTLPKWVIDQLEWQKGDELTLHTDVKQGKITLYRDGKQKEATTEAKTETSPQATEELQPIPKLRW